MTPHRETLFSVVPTSNSLVSVSDPRRDFWADTAPFKGPRLTLCIASETTEIQGHRQVCRAGRGGTTTLSTTTDANLDWAFVENTLFYAQILDCEKSTEYNWVSDQTWSPALMRWCFLYLPLQGWPPPPLIVCSFQDHKGLSPDQHQVWEICHKFRKFNPFSISS